MNGEACLTRSSQGRVDSALNRYYEKGEVNAATNLSPEEAGEFWIESFIENEGWLNPIGMFEDAGEDYDMPSGLEEEASNPAPLARSLLRRARAGGIVTAEEMNLTPKNILGKNAKTKKSEKIGVDTYGLMLAPHKMAGIENICSHASAGCASACLVQSGRADIEKASGGRMIKEARKRRTILLFYNRPEFETLLKHTMDLAIKRAKKKGMKVAFRLNVLSDISWETCMDLPVLVPETATNPYTRVGGYPWCIVQRYPDIQFYDYTKVSSRTGMFMSQQRGMRLPKPWPKNYYLTYSFSEVNLAYCLEVLRLGGSVAVPFDYSLGVKKLPTHWFGFPVINGDESDARFMDRSVYGIPERQGFVVGLSVKGRAQKRAARERPDPWGFIQHAVWAQNGEYERQKDKAIQISEERAEKQKDAGFTRGQEPFARYRATTGIIDAAGTGAILAAGQ
jgi:hypothetical protein